MITTPDQLLALGRSMSALRNRAGSATRALEILNTEYLSLVHQAPYLSPAQVVRIEEIDCFYAIWGSLADFETLDAFETFIETCGILKKRLRKEEFCDFRHSSKNCVK